MIDSTQSSISEKHQKPNTPKQLDQYTQFRTGTALRCKIALVAGVTLPSSLLPYPGIQITSSPSNRRGKLARTDSGSFFSMKSSFTFLLPALPRGGNRSPCRKLRSVKSGAREATSKTASVKVSGKLGSGNEIARV